jgi:hypothetical protein
MTNNAHTAPRWRNAVSDPPPAGTTCITARWTQPDNFPCPGYVYDLMIHVGNGEWYGTCQLAPTLWHDLPPEPPAPTASDHDCHEVPDVTPTPAPGP